MDELNVDIEKTVGREPTILNTPQDAPLVFVEGISGLGVTSGVIKVNFWQQVNDATKPAEINAIYNLRLAVPLDQFVKIARVFARIADELEASDLLTTASAAEQ